MTEAARRVAILSEIAHGGMRAPTVPSEASALHDVCFFELAAIDPAQRAALEDEIRRIASRAADEVRAAAQRLGSR